MKQPTDMIKQALSKLQELDQQLAQMSASLLQKGTVDKKQYGLTLKNFQHYFNIAATYLFYLKFVPGANASPELDTLLKQWGQYCYTRKEKVEQAIAETLTNETADNVAAQLGLADYLYIYSQINAENQLPASAIQTNHATVNETQKFTYLDHSTNNAYAQFGQAILSNNPSAEQPVLKRFGDLFLAQDNTDYDDFAFYFWDTMQQLNQEHINNNPITWHALTSSPKLRMVKAKQTSEIAALSQRLESEQAMAESSSNKKKKSKKKHKEVYFNLEEDNEQPLLDDSINPEDIFETPEGERYIRHSNPVVGGNCGFALFLLPRAEAKRLLLSVSDDPNYRAMAAQEILSALLTTAASTVTGHETDLDNSTFNCSIPLLTQKITFNNEQKTVFELCQQYTKTDNPQLKQAILTALLNFCQTKETYKAYVDGYLTNGWLIIERTNKTTQQGCNLADILAKIMGINLEIWNKNPQTGVFTKIHGYRSGKNKPTLRAVLSSNNGHFDFLEHTHDPHQVKPWEDTQALELISFLNNFPVNPEQYQEAQQIINNKNSEFRTNQLTKFTRKVIETTFQLNRATPAAATIGTVQTEDTANHGDVILDMSIGEPVKLKFTKKGHNAWIAAATRDSDDDLAEADWEDGKDEYGYDISIKRGEKWTAIKNRHGVEKRFLTNLADNIYTQKGNKLVIKIFYYDENGVRPYNSIREENFLDRLKAIYQAAITLVRNNFDFETQIKLLALFRKTYETCKEQIKTQCKINAKEMRPKNAVGLKEAFEPIYKQALAILRQSVTTYAFAIQEFSKGALEAGNIAENLLPDFESINTLDEPQTDTINIYPISDVKEKPNKHKEYVAENLSIWRFSAQRCLGSQTAPTTMRDNPNLLPNLRLVSSGRFNDVIGEGLGEAPNLSEVTCHYYNDVIRHASPGILEGSMETRIDSAKNHVKILIEEMVKLALMEEGQSLQELKGRNIILKLNTMMLLTPFRPIWDQFRKEEGEHNMMTVAYEALRAVARDYQKEIAAKYGFGSLKFEFAIHNIPVKDFKNLKGGSAIRENSFLNRLKTLLYGLQIDLPKLNEINQEGFKSYVLDVNDFLEHQLSNTLEPNSKVPGVIKSDVNAIKKTLSADLQKEFAEDFNVFERLLHDYINGCKKLSSKSDRNFCDGVKQLAKIRAGIYEYALRIAYFCAHTVGHEETQSLRHFCAIIKEYLESQDIFLSGKYKNKAYGHEFPARMIRIINFTEGFINSHCKSSKDRGANSTILADSRATAEDLDGLTPPMTNKSNKDRAELLTNLVSLEIEYGANIEIANLNNHGAYGLMKSYNAYLRKGISDINNMMARLHSKPYDILKGVKIGKKYIIGRLPKNPYKQMEKMQTKLTKPEGAVKDIQTLFHGLKAKKDRFITAKLSYDNIRWQKNGETKNTGYQEQSQQELQTAEAKKIMDEAFDAYVKSLQENASQLIALFYYIRFTSPLSFLYYEELPQFKPMKAFIELRQTLLDDLELLEKDEKNTFANTSEFKFLKALLNEQKSQEEIDGKYDIRSFKEYKTAEKKYLAQDRKIFVNVNKILQMTHGIMLYEAKQFENKIKDKRKTKLQSNRIPLINSDGTGYKTTYDSYSGYIIVEADSKGLFGYFTRQAMRGFITDETGKLVKVAGKCEIHPSKMDDEYRKYMETASNLCYLTALGRYIFFNIGEKHDSFRYIIATLASGLINAPIITLGVLGTIMFRLKLVTFPTQEKIHELSQAIGPLAEEILNLMNNATIASQENHIMNHDKITFMSWSSLGVNMLIAFWVFLVAMFLNYMFYRFPFHQMPDHFIIIPSQSGVQDQYSGLQNPEPYEMYALMNGRYWSIDPAAAKQLLGILGLDPEVLREQLKQKLKKNQPVPRSKHEKKKVGKKPTLFAPTLVDIETTTSTLQPPVQKKTDVIPPPPAPPIGDAKKPIKQPAVPFTTVGNVPHRVDKGHDIVRQVMLATPEEIRRQKEQLSKAVDKLKEKPIGADDIFGSTLPEEASVSTRRKFFEQQAGTDDKDNKHGQTAAPTNTGP